jgi:hypothetical protein
MKGAFHYDGSSLTQARNEQQNANGPKIKPVEKTERPGLATRNQSSTAIEFTPRLDSSAVWLLARSGSKNRLRVTGRIRDASPNADQEPSSQGGVLLRVVVS